MLRAPKAKGKRGGIGEEELRNEGWRGREGEGGEEEEEEEASERNNERLEERGGEGDEEWRRWIAGGGERRREQRAMKEIMVENFMESPASGNCRVCTAGKDVEILKGRGEGGEEEVGD